jgi:hypothetical protein
VRIVNPPHRNSVVAVPMKYRDGSAESLTAPGRP